MESTSTENQVVPSERGWVRVSQIAPTATQQELLNLFGFCGYVSGMKMEKEPDGENQIAIIEFWDKNAVTTACLLSSAIIQGKPIQVELYLADETEQQQIMTSETKSEGVPPATTDPINPVNQSKTAVMAQVFTRGYNLASDTKAKAIAWDTGNLSILQKLEALGTVALHQAALINEKYHLTENKDEFIAAAEKKALEIKTRLDENEKVQAAKAKVTEKVTEIDNKYGISTKVTEIDNKYGISTKAVGLYEQAKQKAIELKEETRAEIARQNELAASKKQAEQKKEEN